MYNKCWLHVFGICRGELPTHAIGDGFYAPSYKKGDNMEQYHKKMKKYYEYNKEKHGKFVN